MGPRDPWFHYMPVRSWPLLSRRPSCVGIPHQTAKEPCTKVWLVWADFSPKAGLSYRVIYVSLESIEKLVMGPIHQRLPKTELSHLPVMSPCRQFICQELELSVLLTPPAPSPPFQLRWVEFHLQWKITVPCKFFGWNIKYKVAVVWLLASSEVCFQKWFHLYI